MNYHQDNLISADSIVARIKQHFKSYFDSGSIDEVLIPTYIDKALRKLHYLVLEEKEDVIDMENFMGRLPDDFSYLKDAYVCDSIEVITNPNFSSKGTYTKVIGCTNCPTGDCVCDRETFKVFQVDSIENTVVFQMGEMMKVYYGSKKFCMPDSKSLRSNSPLEARIDKRTITTNFNCGSVYITYMSRPEDEYGPLIPEVVEVEDYIEAYIIFELFDQLWNSVTDESYNQIAQKRMVYKQEKQAKFESARNFLKLETRQQVRDSITNQRRKLKKYDILG